MTPTRYHLRTLRASMDGETRTLCGRDYIVIPVVALVQGVRHASGSPAPELVLAEAFGRHVDTWNGRPIVVNHPVNEEGRAVLASSPEILETCYLGYLLNARVDDGKLIVDAWLDINAIENADNDGISSMWKRLVDGATVEVSVGAIVYTKRTEGEFEGNKYKGEWDIVIPDHLAFLDGEQTGACSVSDGCGTFRTHSIGVVRLSEGARRNMAGAIKTVRSNPDAGGGVGVGGAVDSTVKTACECKDGQGGIITASQTKEEVEGIGRAWARMLWNSETFDIDRRTRIQHALERYLERGDYGNVVTYNDTVCVYQTYKDGNYCLFQLGYTSNADDTILLSGQPIEVIFQTKVTKVSNAAAETKVAKGDKVSKMLAKKSKTEAKADDEEVVDTTEEEEEEDEEEGDPASKKKVAKKKKMHAPHILALADKLDDCENIEDLAKALSGTGIGKQLASVLKVCNAARDKAIDVVLKSTGGKHFSKEMLAGTDFDVLDKMAVSFLAADRRASDDTDDDESDEDSADDADDDGSDDTSSASTQGLSLGFMDYDAAADAANRPPRKAPAKEQGRSHDQGGKAARLSNGRAPSYGGRAAGQRSAGNGAPQAPDIFSFDAKGKLVA